MITALTHVSRVRLELDNDERTSEKASREFRVEIFEWRRLERVKKTEQT